MAANTNLGLLQAVNFACINEQLKNIPLLHNVFDSRIRIALQNGIEFRVSIPFPIKLQECSDEDFSRVVDILLENAIGASIQSESKYIEVAALRVENFYQIMIANSCPPGVKADKIFNFGYAAEKNHVGQGLGHILNVTVKYRERYDTVMNLETAYSDNIFMAILTFE